LQDSKEEKRSKTTIAGENKLCIIGDEMDQYGTRGNGNNKWRPLYN
jgi:hypothetical protein